MNNVVLVGRLTADPTVNHTAENNSVCNFGIAVQRRFKNANGEYEADFPNCVAFRQTADFVEKYFKKGDPIGVTGRLQTRNYTNKDGNKVYVTEVVVDNVEFVGSKNSGESAAATQFTYTTTPATQRRTPTYDNSFMDIPPEMADNIPF